MITDDQLRQIMPTLPQPKRQQYLPALNAAMALYGVDNMLRTAAFIAQLAHESLELRFMEEIWGPTPAQLRYEPPSQSAKNLGNTQVGDGKRFKGRGPIQITGRFNYKKYGDLLRIDLIGAPEKAATPEIAFATAGLYWKTNGLNELADSEQFVTITKRINGGTNGLPDRQARYAKAKAVLATGFVAGSGAPVSRGASLSPMSPALPDGPLTRGAEVLRKMPAAKKAAPAKKAAAAKKAVAAKKAPAKKVAAKKAPAKKAAAKKVAAKKAAAKKVTTKKKA